MATYKEFFSSGLEMESAREIEIQTSEALRVAAALKCPAELTDYDAAKETLKRAQQRYHELWKELDADMRASAHEMLHKFGGDCGDRSCTLSRSDKH